LSHVRIIRLKNGGRIKHTVDQNLEEKLSKPFLFLQDVKGNITQVFFPHDDQPELVGLKKGNYDNYAVKNDVILCILLTQALSIRLTYTHLQNKQIEVKPSNHFHIS
jgi:hypothetical protein